MSMGRQVELREEQELEAYRDTWGRWGTGFSLNLGVADNMTAELWGILKGLELAWDPGEKRIILETDSKAALQLIQGAGNESPHYNLVSRIRNPTNRSWNCRLQHAWREGNKYADWLAKKSVGEEPGMQIISETPWRTQRVAWSIHIRGCDPTFCSCLRGLASPRVNKKK